MHSIDETIAAIATPLGEGGIAVLRVSGKDAVSSVDDFFVGKKKLSETKSHTAHFGNFISNDGKIIDEVVITIFLAPHSYTGENVAEISCHGGTYITKKILQTIISNNVRIAEPGEFTKRAFLNGKLDLLQAEAVADMIKSRTESAINSSLEQLRGALSKQVKEIRGQLVDLCCMLELELDFIEEGYTFADRNILKTEIQSAIDKISNLLNSYTNGRFFREGVKVVITGKPNVGKSSLLNALLMENKAIVTELPGTTRDVIEGELILDGVLFRFYDTAGIRETADLIETEGIRRTYEKISLADLIINVIDSTDIQELNINNGITNVNNVESTIITVFNKIDILNDEHLENLHKLFNKHESGTVFVSSKTRTGITCLIKKIINSTLNKYPEISNNCTITNIRHNKLLIDSRDFLKKSLMKVIENTNSELISYEIRNALNSLSELTGEVTTEEILNNIFSNFCIGK